MGNPGAFSYSHTLWVKGFLDAEIEIDLRACRELGLESAIVPPDLSTRSISRIATSGLGANMCPNWLRTTSNAPS